MKNLAVITVILAGFMLSQSAAFAQFKTKTAAEDAPKKTTRKRTAKKAAE